MLLSDQWLSAQECKAAGLALAVVPDEELMADALQRAHTLAKFPSVSLVASKRLMKAPYRDAMRRANRDEMDKFIELLAGPACREGLAAFREKRAADFSRF